MKRFIKWTVILLILLVLLAAVGVHFFLDAIVKKGVETVGPRVTKVDVKVDTVSLSLLSGSGKVKGLIVGNPQGYKTPSAINVGSASLSLQPQSVLADKVIIKSIDVEAPDINLESDLGLNTNLKKILANVQESSGSPEKKAAEQTTPSGKPAKKLEVDHFVIKNGKVHVTVNTPIGSQSATVPLPQIDLKDLGTGPEGITPAELAEKVLSVVVDYAMKEGEKVVADIAKGAQFHSGDFTKQIPTNAVEKATKGLGDLLNKGKK